MNTVDTSECLIANARLWDSGRPAAQARRWIENQREGRDFLSLKPSQVSGLIAAVAGAQGPAHFMNLVENHTNSAAKRGKGVSAWERRGQPRPLKDRLQDAMKGTLSDSEKADNRPNRAFKELCKLRGGAQQQVEKVEERRRLEILQEFLAAVVIRYRARKHVQYKEAI